MAVMDLRPTAARRPLTKTQSPPDGMPAGRFSSLYLAHSYHKGSIEIAVGFGDHSGFGFASWREFARRGRVEARRQWLDLGCDKLGDVLGADPFGAGRDRGTKDQRAGGEGAPF